MPDEGVQACVSHFMNQAAPAPSHLLPYDKPLSIFPCNCKTTVNLYAPPRLREFADSFKCYNTSMDLVRPVVWLLVVVWLVSFVGFVTGSVLAVGSGFTIGYELFGVRFPYVAALLLGCMAASSGLLWANYRGEDFRGAEELIYSSLFGVSVFGLMLSVILVLSLEGV